MRLTASFRIRLLRNPEVLVLTAADPFLVKQLNPLFLNAWQNYWVATLQAKEGEKDVAYQVQFHLLQFLFRRLLQPLYAQHPPTIEGDVFFLSHILPDGIGDYYSLLKSARILKLYHPVINVQLAYLYRVALPPVDLAPYLLTQNDIHAFYDQAKDSLLETFLEGRPIPVVEEELALAEEKRKGLWLEELQIRTQHGYTVKALEELLGEADREISLLRARLVMKKEAEAIYKRMQESLALVHIAIALNTFNNPDLVANSFYFAEAGNFQGIANLLKLNWFSMGLLPFEEGLFLREPFAISEEWHDFRLPQLFWNKKKPTEKEVSDYLHRHSLHLGYFSKPSIQPQIFVNLICLQQKTDSRHIDIVLSKSKQQEFSWNREWLGKQGIAKVVMVDFSEGLQEHLLAETTLSQGKTLRLIRLLPLSTHDYKRLLGLCGHLVGCTGDGSLSDCLTLEKIPFYELRKHKQETWQGMLDIAQLLGLKNVATYWSEMANFSSRSPELLAEKLHHSLSSEEFKSEWRRQIRFLKRYYCFEDSLIAHLNRHFWLRKRPDLLQLESQLIRECLEEKITPADAFAAFQKEIESQ